ncbi:MAG: SbcC/MukB-like Walker B domain-containing protein, partial [Caldicoprobacter sp.]|uniref:ATP-binding protein n=1 Tax=Caldicoprobacter sp. TaxID=2004500 RepID=UPI0039C3EF7C
LMKLSQQALICAQQLIKADEKVLDAIAAEGFNNIIGLINKLKQTAGQIKSLIDSAITKAERLLDELADEVENLKRGVKPYPRNLLALKEEIARTLSTKYGDKVQVHILADLLEIRDMRWKNAVEAYLHTQKFYLIVEPEHFLDALKVYDRLKFEKGFYDLGLVDTGKLAQLKPAAMENSLAQEVETSNRYARMFVDFVMGNVIKCNDLEELRNYPRSITDSCMLYQNFVARQLHPDRWKNPYIGRRSIEEQIENKTAQIAQIEKEVTSFKNLSNALSNIYSMESINLNEAENITEVLEQSKNIPALEEKLDAIVDELSKLDLTWLEQLDKKIKKLEKEIENLKKQENDCLIELIDLKNKNKYITENSIPSAKQNIELYQNRINSQFTDEWVQKVGEPRFQKELSSRASANEIYNNFYSQLARTQSQMNKKWEELVSARAEYNREHRMSYDINLPDNAPYEKELNELKDIKLPEYLEKIKDAKEKAFQQFREDFLAKLKANIDMVKEQIEELNSALKESSFGNDRYRFVVSPRPEYRRFYDMITDELLMDGYNLASHVFFEKHKDAIEELFKQITDIDLQTDADTRIELEKNIKRFTDYRTYLTFDLIVTDNQGREQRLSKTLRKKSGGETQTPFYIAMLASFAQLYRTRYNNESGNTIRLIMFDEAFSKMDSDRIQESIKLLRKFGLQAILAAPSEKIGDIAPLVDRTLCVIRSENRSFVKAFDAKKLKEELHELQEADTQPIAR